MILGMSSVLERVGPTPRALSTGNSGEFPPQSLGVCVFGFVLFAGNHHVRGSCQLRGQKKGKKVD